MEDDSRPAWTFAERTTKLWSEDDATTSDPDHETWRKAYRRIFGHDAPPGIEKWDGGDSDFLLTAEGVVIVSSYSGNSQLRILRPPLVGHVSEAAVAETAARLQRFLIGRCPTPEDGYNRDADFSLLARAIERERLR